MRLPNGLQTKTVSYGKNLSTGQIRRIMIARAIVHKPRLLVLDEAFTGIEENMKLEIIQDLYSKKNNWTVLSITHDPEVVSKSEAVYVISDGKIIEKGTPHSLFTKNDSLFKKMFPELALQHHHTTIEEQQKEGN
jgi:ABC-type bacteriocin/lantibiotic exporter with double-glycine peptidase domain